MPSPSDITRLLDRVSAGTPEALNELMPLVYGELRALAKRCLRAERNDHTLQATALVNEAYLKLIGQTKVDWKNRAHFFSIAAQAMRRILVDHARAKKTRKRGGDYQRVTLTSQWQEDGNGIDLLELEDLLEKLAEIDERKVKVLELRFFADLSIEEIGEVLEVAPRTVDRDWKYAKAWLLREFGRDQQGERSDES